jgi:hypothetical protein
MSSSDEASLADVLSQCSDRCTALIENGELRDLPVEAFGILFATLVRVLAERAQSGALPPVTGGNTIITATDGAIACTAILEAAGIEVFELSAWQALTDVGSRRRETPEPQFGV